MVNLIWFTNEKVFIASVLSNVGTWNQASCDPKNATILQAPCASALSCLNMWNSNYPHRHVNAIALHVFVAATVKLQKFVIGEPNFSPSEQGSDRQHQLRQSSLYPWCQHYVSTSKEYLINCHILLQYFELVFFQLQLVKILCKLIIIWVNYEKNKKSPFFMKHHVYVLCYCHQAFVRTCVIRVCDNWAPLFGRWTFGRNARLKFRGRPQLLPGTDSNALSSAKCWRRPKLPGS